MYNSSAPRHTSPYSTNAHASAIILSAVKGVRLTTCSPILLLVLFCCHLLWFRLAQENTHPWRTKEAFKAPARNPSQKKKKKKESKKTPQAVQQRMQRLLAFRSVSAMFCPNEISLSCKTWYILIDAPCCPAHAWKLKKCRLAQCTVKKQGDDDKWNVVMSTRCVWRKDPRWLYAQCPDPDPRH
jgi:hypothetical protein